MEADVRGAVHGGLAGCRYTRGLAIAHTHAELGRTDRPGLRREGSSPQPTARRTTAEPVRMLSRIGVAKKCVSAMILPLGRVYTNYHKAVIFFQIETYDIYGFLERETRRLRAMRVRLGCVSCARVMRSAPLTSQFAPLPRHVYAT